jgi:NAD(P)-dependent dehydrogenase (short-subunit alcohol dehydrogenase family)
MSAELAGRRVLITGVTSGIGKATVDALLAEGASVIGVGRDRTRLERLAAAWGSKFTPVVADLAAGVAEVTRAVQDPLAAVINNAAEVLYESPLGLSQESWARLFEVNVIAPVQLVRALRDQLGPGSQVINISSVNAHGVQNLKFAPYGASKGALAQLTQALRMELAPRGIRVCQVTPGLVDTELYQKVAGFERVAEKLRAAIPQWLSAEDVARSLVWILTQPPHVTVGDLVLLPTGQS